MFNIDLVSELTEFYFYIISKKHDMSESIKFKKKLCLK